MKIRVLAFLAGLALWASGQADPFAVTLRSDVEASEVVVEVSVPTNHYLYKSAYKVEFVAGVEAAE